jgi:peptide/nickel transport system substrate-binding protein
MTVWTKGRTGALVAATLIAGSLAGPGVAQDAFRIAITQSPVSMDPIVSSDNASIWMQLLINDTLVRPADDASGLEPGLAESWTRAEDGLSYTFDLREASFADGSPVTSQDVVFSLDRARAEGSRWAGFFATIDTVEAVDDDTVTVALSRPFTPLLNNLALFSAAILPKAAVEAGEEAFFDRPFGAGPFQVDEWRKGEGLALSANPNYWEAGKPSLQAVEVMVVSEGNSRVLQLEAGEIHAAIDIPLNQMERLAETEGVNVATATVFRTDFMLFNTQRPPFDDVRVRQALNHAVDKEGIVSGLLFGGATVAASPMPPMQYADPDLAPYSYDPERARELLAEAGYPDGFETEMLVISGIPLHRQVSQALQSYFAEVGVTVELQVLEGGAHWAATGAGEYDVALSYSTSDTIDPDQLVGFLLVNPERANAYHTEWKSERVNELYELERQTPNGAEREAMFREIVRLAHEGAPSLFLYHPGATYAYRDGVEGFRVLPTSNFRLEDVTLAP